jgi:hypothetical protein
MSPLSNTRRQNIQEWKAMLQRDIPQKAKLEIEWWIKFAQWNELLDTPKNIMITTRAPLGLRQQPLTDKSPGIEPPFSLSYMRRRHVPREEKIRTLAYNLWLQRGSPIGSPEVDWLEAERLMAEAEAK